MEDLLRTVDVGKTCPICGRPQLIQLTESQYASYAKWVENGKDVPIQRACPTMGVFERETLINGLCFDCQSSTYNIPMPGHEEEWGEELGTCPECDCSIWEKDIDENGEYTCPCCGEPGYVGELL